MTNDEARAAASKAVHEAMTLLAERLGLNKDDLLQRHYQLNLKGVDLGVAACGAKLPPFVLWLARLCELGDKLNAYASVSCKGCLAVFNKAGDIIHEERGHMYSAFLDRIGTRIDQLQVTPDFT